MSKTQTDRQAVAGEVRAAIARAGLSHMEVASRIGMDRQVLGRKLNGYSPIGLEEIAAISQALGVSPASLIGPALDAAA